MTGPLASSSAPDLDEWSNLIACHDCDALFEMRPLEPGEVIVCPHCSARLHARRINSVHRSAALAVSAAAFFIVANMFPFIQLKAAGQISRIVLAQSVSALNLHGRPVLAAFVAIFILAAPLMIILGMLYLLLPLLKGRRWPGAVTVCRLVYGSQTWSMVEVFLIGVLVSLLKLGDIADVTLGLSFWAFAGLIICLTAAQSAVDRHELWDQLEAAAP